MNLLENRVAIVTGAGRGIGSSIARKFGEHGAKVVVHYNSSAKPAEELASKINSIAIQADLTNPTDCQRLVDQTMSEYGKIDILVNCASSFAGGKTIVEDTWESYQEEIKGVLGTTFHLIKCVAPLMIAAKYGRRLWRSYHG
jgi:NAD(P)-dependent dehydrogenase (short-subunit alcohol dehydrogenase family)